MTTKQIHQFWSAEPYPHLIIDNWMEPRLYADIVMRLRNINDKPSLSFSTNIEAGKTTYDSDSEIGRVLQPFVDSLVCAATMKELRELTGIKEITPLTEMNVNTNYKYFHQMQGGGVLGSHVDHSQIYDKQGKIVDERVHFLNAIFYADIPQFASGGSTALYRQMGWGQPVKRVSAIPNRLLLFLHSSNSFHGVVKLNSGWVYPRTTIYMDYYCKAADLPRRFSWWKHRTTFVPKSWRPSYWYWYFDWLRREQF
jgi:hypothetical protein